jgi:hypothetical protein
MLFFGRNRRFNRLVFLCPMVGVGGVLSLIL